MTRSATRIHRRDKNAVQPALAHADSPPPRFSAPRRLDARAAALPSSVFPFFIRYSPFAIRKCHSVTRRKKTYLRNEPICNIGFKNRTDTLRISTVACEYPPRL